MKNYINWIGIKILEKYSKFLFNCFILVILLLKNEFNYFFELKNYAIPANDFLLLLMILYFVNSFFVYLLKFFLIY